MGLTCWYGPISNAFIGMCAKWLLIMMMLMIFAGAIELAQFFAPGRHPSRIDFVVDAFAACAGAAIALVLMKLRGRAARS